MSPGVILLSSVTFAAVLLAAAVTLALRLGGSGRMSDTRRGWALYSLFALGAGVLLGMVPIKGEVGGGEIADCGRLLHPDRSNNYGGAEQLSSDVRNFCRQGYEERAKLLVAVGIVASAMGIAALRAGSESAVES